MLDTITWLSASGFGALFGFSPAWWWFSAYLVHSVAYERKEVPGWMSKIAINNPGWGLFSLSLFHKHYYPIILRVCAVSWVIASLVFYHWTIWADISKGNLIEIAAFESSFTLFLCLTWLLPGHFLKRYLRKLNPKEDKGSGIELRKMMPNRGSVNNIVKSLTLMFILMVVIAVVTLYGQPITSPTVILAIIGLFAVGSLTVAMNLRARRGKSRNNTRKQRMF